MSIFKITMAFIVFIGLVGATLFLSSCDGLRKHSSQEVDGGYGGHGAGGHGGHGGGH
ncbi:TPA: hypothetical protein ACHW7I_000969 [Legionella pneumophila]|uniref:Uncharacterized protein n=3 Tax=Legionella TaxID=445 RepID=A0A0W0XQK4_9GAMM|nr:MULTISPECIES: hypothetical protein [Legionella]AMV15590.1 hypothetical protein ULM_29300 [Legionella pneumophila]ETO94074.1 hypothetical protein LOR_52c10750 [Legionella oakridgensis RV-2-2007]KTD07321.1 hypothetical protein Ljam_1516 [Legionella jamestowniensis]KTD46878.1 hypothetical protein Lrub_1800 [Legionella rubrilucens]MBN5929244.1 hypothetical protein [Legionella pneumophila]